MQTNLVQAYTADDLILNGLLNNGDTNKPAVILIHGFTSDFYSHKFFHTIQSHLTEENIANIAIQTRGTGIHTEFLNTDRQDGKYIGSYYEKLSEAHLDISAWIKFLQEAGYKDIILAGHSLGTIKAVRYMYEGEYRDKVKKLVLLAPFDKNGYIQRHSGAKRASRLEEAVAKLKEGNGEETVPNNFEDYPISYETYVSWYENNDLSNMFDFYLGVTADFPILKKLKVPVKVIVGTKDEDFYIPEFSTLTSTTEILNKNIKRLEIDLIEGAGHTYVGHEDQVAKSVTDYIRK